MQNPAGHYWAMWWAISLAVAFLVAAAISLAVGPQPQNDRVYAVRAR
jgi:hypothetical protein